VLGSWISPSCGTADAAPTIRYLTDNDPSGTWGTATSVSILSGGSTVDETAYSSVGTDGTATYVCVQPATGNKTGVWYATSPDTWLLTEIASTRHIDVAYGNGYWVAAGDETSGFWDYGLSYATTPSGSWTNVSRGDTGAYFDVEYAAGTFVRGWWSSASGNTAIEYASDPTGSWSTAHTESWFIPLSIRYLNELWVVSGYYVGGTASGATKIYWTDDLSMGLPNQSTCGFASGYIEDVAFDGTYWVVTGRDSGTLRTRYFEGPAPSGTFTTVTTGFTQDVRRLASANGYIVGATFLDARVRCTFTNSPEPPIATGPTYLRLHQSPVRTPSRVRGLDIRQRQTPFITK
jgi:hypothetical protein